MGSIGMNCDDVRIAKTDNIFNEYRVYDWKLYITVEADAQGGCAPSTLLFNLFNQSYNNERRLFLIISAWSTS